MNRRSRITRFFTSDVFMAGVLAVLVRVLFILLVSHDAVSQDGLHAAAVADVLRRGGNPYAETAYLNWPPFWMQVIFILDRLSLRLDIPFLRMLQGTLMVAELCLLAVLAGLLKGTLGIRRPLWYLVLGISSNPAAVLNVTLSGHFDVIVALLVMLAVLALCRFLESGELADWLLSCAAVGAGVLAKTVPVVLLPLLFVAARRLDWRARLLGVWLALGPAMVGLSVIYVLAPEDINTKVIGYRSAAGWFGITGLLQMRGWDWFSLRIYPGIFFLALLSLMMLSARALQRRAAIQPQEVLLWALLLLLFCICFGPGYGTQYHYWIIPLVVAVCAGVRTRQLRILGVLYLIVAAATLSFQYGIELPLGAFFRNISCVEALPEWYTYFPGKVAGTIVGLPLFAVMAALFVSGLAATRQRRKTLTSPGEPRFAASHR